MRIIDTIIRIKNHFLIDYLGNIADYLGNELTQRGHRGDPARLLINLVVATIGAIIVIIPFALIGLIIVIFYAMQLNLL